MLIIRTLCFICCLPIFAMAQGLDLQFVNNLGSTNYDHCSGMVLDAEENVYITGYFSGDLFGQAAYGASDSYIAKYNSEGVLQWIKIFGGQNDDRAAHLAIDTARQLLFITGFYSDKLFFGSDSLEAIHGDDLLLLCINTTGHGQWGRGFGTHDTQWGNRVAVDAQHNIYLSGFFEDTLQADGVQLISRGLRNAFILKLDSSGFCNWGYRMGGPLYDEGSDICFDEHNNIYMVGSYRDSADIGPYYFNAVYTYDCFLASWKPDGQWRWARSFGGGYIDVCQSICLLPNSQQLALGGWFFSNITFDTIALQASGEEESFLAVYDTNGQVQWAKRFGDVFAELIYDLEVDTAENIYAVGSFDSIIHFGNEVLLAKHFNQPTDVFVLRFSPTGDYMTGFRAGDVYNDFGYHIALADSSMIYLSGNYQNRTIFEMDTLFALGQYDVFLAKYYFDSTYHPPPLANIKIADSKTTDLQLYPNPVFNGNCWISADLPPCAWGDQLALNVFDLNGRLVHQQKMDEQGARLSCSLDLGGLASGLYVVRVRGKCFEGMAKMRLMEP